MGRFRVHKARDYTVMSNNHFILSKPLPKIDIDVYNGTVRVYKALTKERDAADQSTGKGKHP